MRGRSLALILLAALTAVAAAQAVPPGVRVSSGVMIGLLQSKVDPVYPPLARQARIQGTVLLQVQISKAGDVENIQVVSGHAMLVPAAIEAVKQWRYKPYLLNGEPAMVNTQVQVNFALSDKPQPNSAGNQSTDAPPLNSGAVTGTIVTSPQSGTAITLDRHYVRISSGVAQGLLQTKVPPEYPQVAKEQRIQGTVLMQIVISKEGTVEQLNLISGHPLLAPPAIKAVRQWKYQPYFLNGEPVEVETQVQVNFTLAD